MCRIVVLLLTIGIATATHGDQPESVRVSERELWQALDLDRPELAVNGRNLLSADCPVTKEIAIDR